jgi:hypothetical protein
MTRARKPDLSISVDDLGVSSVIEDRGAPTSAGVYHGPSVVSSEDEFSRCINTIPYSHRHLTPAISRFDRPMVQEGCPSLPDAQLDWAEKWRPQRAEECIGNEENALYLRDWLCALALQEHDLPSTNVDIDDTSKPGKTSKQKMKRSRVVRSIAKTRGRKRIRLESDDEDNSWIAASDDVDYMEEFTTDDELLLGSAPNSPPPSSYTGSDAGFDSNASTSDRPQNGHIDVDELRRTKPRRPVTFDDRLTNTILLVGPHGCGKTAAIYACAAELSWDVFEVYPGIGKRSGANLDTLVGEVGKNHLVNAAQRKGTVSADASSSRRLYSSLPYDAISGDLSQGSSRLQTKRLRRAGEGAQASDVNDRRTAIVEDIATVLPPFDGNSPGIIPPQTAETDKGRFTSVKQSIVLLEEVDILFKDDVNFWPSVVDLIKDCRRPVVMTCNGQLPCILLFDVLSVDMQTPGLSLLTPCLYRRCWNLSHVHRRWPCHTCRGCV